MIPLTEWSRVYHDPIFWKIEKYVIGGLNNQATNCKVISIGMKQIWIFFLVKYFTTPERIILIKSFFYSCLYYGSQAWLIPSLRGALKSKLFSASGAALRLLVKDSLFKDLHKKFNRATPTQFQKYTTAVSLYDLIKKEIPEDEWINLQFNIQNDWQSKKLSFQANNKLKCGFNCQSNRFRSITNEIESKKRLIIDKLLSL